MILINMMLRSDLECLNLIINSFSFMCSGVWFAYVFVYHMHSMSLETLYTLGLE